MDRFQSCMREFLQRDPSHFWKTGQKGICVGGCTHVGSGLLTAPPAVRNGGLSGQEMTWPSRWETTTPAALNILGHYERLRRPTQQIIANPGSKSADSSILKKKRNNNPRGLLIHYIGKELCTSLHLMCVHWDDTAGTSSLLMIWSGLAFLQKHTKCDRIPKRHILICWKALRFATGLCSNFLFIWPLVLITRKIKSPWMTCTLGWQAKERLVLTSLYFPQNRPLCPCAALGVGEDKQTAQSNVTRRPQNKSRTPGADWQSHSCCPLSVLHCTSVKCHPHAHQLPHRSNENVYDITKADFPTSHHWTKAPKIPSAKREKWRKSSHVHFGQGTNG